MRLRLQHILNVSAIALASSLFLSTSCAGASSEAKYGPFRGQIVDVETGGPIVGAAVLAVRWDAVFSPVGHPTREFYDAREAVTDPEGRFEIPKLSVPFWKLGVQPGQVTYFAPGYVAEAEVVAPPDGQRFVDPTVVKMRRLKTRKELLEKSRARPVGVPLERMVEFTRAINVESRMLGLEPLPINPRSGREP
jgi:hypothetical protein